MEDKNKIIIGIVVIAIAVGCGYWVWQPPTDGGEGKPPEPVVKNAEEAIDLVYDKHKIIVDDICISIGERLYTIDEIPNGWNITRPNCSIDCEGQCFIRHYHEFFVYKDGRVIKNREYWMAFPVPTPLLKDGVINLTKDNESFFIQEGQKVKGKIFELDVTAEYVTHLRIVEMKINGSGWNGEFHEEEGINVDSICSGDRCEYDTPIELMGGSSSTTRWLNFKIKPVVWVMNNSEATLSFDTLNTTWLYLEVYEEVEFIPPPPGPIQFNLKEGEIKNFSYGYGYKGYEKYMYDITVHYMSSSPKQVFEFIVDDEKYRFEIDPVTNVVTVNGVEEGVAYDEELNYWYGYKFRGTIICFMLDLSNTQLTWNTAKELSFDIDTC